MQKDSGHNEDENTVTWLLQCWDNRVSGLELEGKEARQLGSLLRDAAIDSAIATEKDSSSLWSQLLAATKVR